MAAQQKDDAVYINRTKLLGMATLKVAIGAFLLVSAVGGALKFALTRSDEPWWGLAWVLVFCGIFAICGLGVCFNGYIDFRQRAQRGPVLRFTDDGLVFGTGILIFGDGGGVAAEDILLPWSAISEAWVYERAAHTNPFENELNINWVGASGKERTWMIHTSGLTMSGDEIATRIRTEVEKRAVDETRAGT